MKIFFQFWQNSFDIVMVLECPSDIFWDSVFFIISDTISKNDDDILMSLIFREKFNVVESFNGLIIFLL